MAEHYWINDLFPDLRAFWGVVQDPAACRKLCRSLRGLRARLESPDQAKECFRRFRRETPQDQYRQAYLFFFLNRVSFSGTTRAGGFSSHASTGRFTESCIDRVAALPLALQGVKITQLDFQAVIEAPGEDVFVFLDPPYYQSDRLYGHQGQLHHFDHERLARVLRKTRHRFLMTYDDCPEVRELYCWARIEEWQLRYGMNNCNRERTSKKGCELFISNYERN